MTSFRYQAIGSNGASASGVIDAEDRKGALQLLSERGLFPSALEACGERGKGTANIQHPTSNLQRPTADSQHSASRLQGERPAASDVGGWKFGASVRRKEITAFTREIAALLEAGIPIPQALAGLSEEEENPALKAVLVSISESVRKGTALSAALGEHPRLFDNLYVSMVRVGEEAGALQKVMTYLAGLLEHEDEVRGEVMGAVAYPCFVLAFGVVTVAVLLGFVLPRLFTMLEEMLSVLPLPTLILLRTSGFLQDHWPWILAGAIGAIAGLRGFLRSPQGALLWDGWKLHLPVIGGVFRSAALSRFARTLGTLVRSGVSLLPALKIVENTIGNLVMAGFIARVTEETRGGDSLAGPLRKLGLFPRNVVQMISVGEETGRLDEMLLKVAEIEERHMRAKTRTVISLLAPALILAVGALVGFIVIALLLPIFRMSQGIH